MSKRKEPTLNLAALRRERGFRQIQVAALMQTQQSEISKMERRKDWRASILARYIQALGGRLEIWAHFPDRPSLLLSGHAHPLTTLTQRRKKPEES